MSIDKIPAEIASQSRLSGQQSTPTDFDAAQARQADSTGTDSIIG